MFMVTVASPTVTQTYRVDALAEGSACDYAITGAKLDHPAERGWRVTRVERSA